MNNARRRGGSVWLKLEYVPEHHSVRCTAGWPEDGDPVATAAALAETLRAVTAGDMDTALHNAVVAAGYRQNSPVIAAAVCREFAASRAGSDAGELMVHPLNVFSEGEGS